MIGDPGPIGMAAIGSACAIFDRQGRVLLVRHTYGRLNWEIPGGIALPAEPPSQTATRELREETGLSLPEGELSGVYFERHHSLGGPAIHFVFRYRGHVRLDPRPASDEIGELGWYEPDKLPAPMSDFTEIRIRDALSDGAVYRVIEGRSWRT